MFGKKQPPAPKALWTVQLLLRDYLVEGHTDGDDATGPLFLTVQAGNDLDMATLTLTEPSVQPTGSLNVAVPPASKWVLPTNAEYVAVIPRDPGSTAYALQNKGPAKALIGAIVIAGPYSLRGAVICPGRDLDILCGYQTFAMQDVTIDSLAPGARLSNFAAPHVVVRTLAVQGFFVNA